MIFPSGKCIPNWSRSRPLNWPKLGQTGEAVIIDVRTKGEFDVIHVKGAINISHIVSDEQQAAFKSVAEKPHQYLVFYCNGVTCPKSYKAADLAMTMLHLQGGPEL